MSSPKDLKELADQETAHEVKYRQMMSKREIHDAEMERRRTEEDGEYAAILAARAREEEQKS